MQFWCQSGLRGRSAFERLTYCWFRRGGSSTGCRVGPTSIFCGYTVCAPAYFDAVGSSPTGFRVYQSLFAWPCGLIKSVERAAVPLNAGRQFEGTSCAPSSLPTAVAHLWPWRGREAHGEGVGPSQVLMIPHRVMRGGRPLEIQKLSRRISCGGGRRSRVSRLVSEGRWASQQETEGGVSAAERGL